MRYLLTLRYIGTRYHGWQVQQNALAVQPVVQDALERVLGARPALSGCSRTDSGVHANEYCCHFDAGRELSCEALPRSLNFFLPQDIAVCACHRVPEGFHARYSCTGKEYLYQIYNGRCRNPFLEPYSLHITCGLDEERLHKAARGFVGRHDFAGFCSAGAKEGSTVRTVREASVTREGELVLFRVQADGFLYNMVRIMAGTLVQVGFGKIQPEDVPGIVASCQRRRAGPTAPAKGLFLNRVLYEDGMAEG